jgi:adenylate cyclase
VYFIDKTLMDKPGPCMRNKVESFILVTLLLLASFLAHKQSYALSNKNQYKIDSLTQQLAVTQVDTTRVFVLLKLVSLLPCNDSLQKITYANQAIAIARKSQWLRGLSLSYHHLSDIYQYCTMDVAKSIITLEQFIEIAAEKNDTNILSKSYTVIGMLHKDVGNYAQALDYLHKALVLQTNNARTIDIWANIGETYRSLGDYTKALGCYEHSLRLINDEILAKKSGAVDYTLMQAGLMVTTAGVYESMGEYDKAMNNYQKVMAVGVQAKQPYVEYLANEGMGRCYDLKEQNDTAIYFYLKALTFMRNSTLPIGNTQSILNKLGSIYLAKGAIKEALNNTNEALKMATNAGDKDQLSIAFTVLGNIYTHTGNYAQAINYLQQAVSISKEIGAKVNEKNAWEALSATYAAMNKPDKAFDAYKVYISLRDSVYNTDKAKELTRMDMQGEFDRKNTADSVRLADEKKITDLTLQRQRALTYSALAGAGLLLLLAFFIYRNYDSERKANLIISKANDTIKKEKLVSELLLLNILPEQVAEELKTHGKVQARLYNNVSVLFTDFVNFTAAGEHLNPQELVAELDTCFRAFDEIVSKYHVEKIKTVGDAYLAVAGLPHADPLHAVNTVKAAIEIRDYMVARKKQMGSLTFDIRIGINTGEVVAGIVGARKYAYDIWGDTVNTAARMEQNSEAGKINISQTTYELVKNKFTCEYRGEVEAKGKGVLKMYYLSTEATV